MNWAAGWSIVILIQLISHGIDFAFKLQIELQNYSIMSNTLSTTLIITLSVDLFKQRAYQANDDNLDGRSSARQKD